MKRFFATLPRNLADCFRGRRWLWHLAMTALTAVLVLSGFDWFYFSHTRSRLLWDWMFPAAPIGGLVPLLLPLALIVLGRLPRGERINLAGWAIGQAELLGSLLSSAYKAFTGRLHPQFAMGPDISHVFRFGFLRGGMFWGWPSSHTTIAFAMAVTVLKLFPRQKWVGAVALLYAAYIGIGVSMTIHWFSDFTAGAILGSVIGTVVGKSWLANLGLENPGPGNPGLGKGFSKPAVL